MRFTILALSILFITVVVSSPLRFAYAQTDPSAPVPTIELQIRSALREARASQVVSSVALAAQGTNVWLHRLANAITGGLDFIATKISTSLAETTSRSFASDNTNNSPAAVSLSFPSANAPPTSSVPVISSASPTKHVPAFPGASSGQSIGADVPSSSDPNSSLVTQDQLTAAVTQAVDSLRSLIYAQSANAPAFTPPQIAAGGNGVYYGGVAAPVTQINATTIPISGITANIIPPLAYLSSSGGAVSGTTTVAGAFGVGTTSPSDTLAVNGAIYLADAAPSNPANRLYARSGSLYFNGNALGSGGGGVSTTTVNVWTALQNFFGNASSTGFSANYASFGGTATSSFDTAGNLTLAAPLAVTSGGTGWNSINLGSILFGNGSSAVATSNSLFWDNMNSRLGIGTTSPQSAFAVSGGATIGADYNTAAPTNGLAVEGGVGIGTTTVSVVPDSFSYLLNAVSDSKSPVLRLGDQNPSSSSISPSIDIDSYNVGNPAQSGQVAFRDFPGSYSSPGGSLPSGTLLGGYQFEVGNFSGTNWVAAASMKATTDEPTSDTALGSHLSFFTAPLSGSTAGVGVQERVRIAPNGIGIRTTSPTFGLDVKGFGRISTTTFTGTGLNDGTAGGTYTGTDISAVTYTIIIDGTGTPDTFKWQKNSGSFATGVAMTGSSQTLTDGVSIKFTATTGHTLNDQWVITVTPQNPFGVQNAAGTRSFSIENNGTVGIGTTSPNSLLEISASNANTTLATFGDPALSITNRSTTNNTFASLAFQTQSTNGASSTAARISGITTSHTNGAVSGNLAFLVSNAGTLSEAARFNASGQLGIGTTSPYAQLSVFAGGDYASHAASTLFAIASSTAGTATSTFMVVTSAGNVGIASTSPWRTLDVNGTVGFKNLSSVSTNQSAYLCLSSNNEVVQDSTTCLSSSARFKQNIEPLAASSSLAEVLALNPVSFQYTPAYNGSLQTDPNFNGTFVGFIAEDVAKIDPRLITVDDTGPTPNAPHGVRYENITALLAGAIQEIATISGAFEQNIIAWLGNSENGIHDLFAGTVHAHQFCAQKSDSTEICVTGDELASLLAASSQSSSASVSTQTANIASTTLDAPPIIQVNGDNPAIIHVGDSYADLGATITGPQQDLNLDIKHHIG
jgi:Chaperone of endosialidase